jgi:hypothetical protein
MARRDFIPKKLATPPYKENTMKEFILGGLMAVIICAVVFGTNYLRTGYVI